MTALVVSFLNDLIDNPVGLIKPDEARKALLAIETQQLAINALRTLLQHPKNPESFAHAERLLKQIDSAITPAVNTADDLV